MLGLMLLILYAPGSFASDTQAVIGLAPDATVRGGTEPGEARTYSISLGAGEAAVLVLRQLGDRSPELTWSGVSSLPPIRLSAGRGAERSITLVAPEPRTWLFRVAARSGHYAAAYELSLGRTHPVMQSDRTRADAEITLAHADDLRLISGSTETGRQGGQSAVARARDAYETAAAAWRAAADDCGRRQVLTGLARLDFAHGDYRGAKRAAEDAAHLDCPRDRDAGGAQAGAADRAEALRTLGAALNYEGDLEAAIAAQKHALALYEQTGDQRFQEVVLGNLSDDLARTGQLGQALEAAQSALRTAQALDDRQGVEFSREQLATLQFTRGDLNAAMANYLETLDALKKTPYPLVENMANNDLGRLYRVLGGLDQSRQAYENAEAVARASEDHAAVAEALRNQADIALDAGQADVAAGLFSKALDLAREGGYKSIEADSLRGLGRCAARREQWEESRQLLRQAYTLAAASKDVVVRMRVGLAGGDLESARKHWKAAQADYAAVYALARRAQVTDIQPVALASLARARQSAGELPRARRDIEQALALIESQRTSIDNPAFRTSYLSSRRAYYGLYIDILMDLERDHPGCAYAGKALEVSERARGRSLQDLLSERRLSVDAHIDERLFAAERSAEDQLSLLVFERGRLPVRGGDAARVRLQGEIDRVSAQLDEARGRIRAANPRYAELLNPPKLGLPEMRKQLLDPQTTLLEYWLGERQSYLWLLHAGTVKAVTLPPRDRIEAAVAPLLQAMQAQASRVDGVSMEARAAREAERLQAIHTLSHALAESLFGPVRRYLGTDQVVIVADGILSQLPFGLLDTDAHDFTYLPSLQTVRWLRGQSTPPRAQAVAVMADPVFSGNDERLHAPGHGGPNTVPDDVPRPGELRRLRYSRQEAAGIAALAAPGSTWVALDFAASRQAALQARWQDYPIVHFATHALIDQRHPDLSGIALSQYDAAGKPLDGLLSMNDIYNLKLPADLVVLSACESASGKMQGEEGVLSLSRAFFYAGTRRVLASLWPVDDRASARFMERFYTALLQGRQAPAAALRTAQLQMAADPDWLSPYYWAGYVLQGDWR